METMNIFNKNVTQTVSLEDKKSYLQDSLIQIWGRFLGYPVNYSDLNKIKDGYTAIYKFVEKSFENASPDDFNAVINFVVSTVDKEFGLYRDAILDFIK